jgi:hypothetical protein
MVLAAAFVLAAAGADPVLPGLWSLSPIGFGLGVIALVYWLLISGRLIPRSSHERELAAANLRGNEWKDAALALEKVNAEVRRQNGQLTGALHMAAQNPAGPPREGA